MYHRMKITGSLEISYIDVDAAAANEGKNMSVGGASVGGAPAGIITHQYYANLSLEEAELYEKRMNKMKKGKTTSTKLKTSPPPLNKWMASINRATFRVDNCVEVAEDIRFSIPGWHFHGGIGYVPKVEGTRSNTIF